MDAVVLTSENASAFYAKRLDLAPEPAAPAEPAKAAEAEPVVESVEKVATVVEPVDEADDKQVPNPEARQKLNVRFSELTEQRKAAEAVAEKAQADAQAAHEARVLAEKRAAELQAKYEPPKPDELGPEPQRDQFVNDDEFLASVKEYAADKALRERDQKDAQAKIAASWSERQASVKAEIPSYEADINAASHLVVSNEVSAAILDSEVGPKILHHLATNPVLVDELSKMKRDAAMRMIGRLEAQLLGTKVAPATAKAEAVKPVVAASEPSRAPAPITPLKGANAPAASPLDSKGEFHGTHAEWRAARRAGLIK